MKKLKIGNHKIAEGLKPFVIAEAGVNHNGYLDEAFKLAKKAKEVGADCIKFQTFKTDDLLIPNTKKANYQKKNTKNSSSQNLMLKKLEFTHSQFQKLFEYCKKIDIEFMSTPYSFEDVDFLDQLGVNAFKLSSMHLSEPFFIKYVLKKNKPVIISTGMSNFIDIKYAMEYVRNQKNKKIILLHCTTDYPTSNEDVNLLSIKALKKNFDKLIGFSDHSNNNLSSIMSVALGACVIEKHFTLNKKDKGPDHNSSLDPKDFAKLIVDIKDSITVLGSSKLQLTKSEKSNSKVMKRSIVAKNDLLQGIKISINDIAFKRPMGGLEPRYLDDLLGKRLNKDLKKNSYILFKDVS